MSSNHPQTFYLDPQNHRDGVTSFLDYYGLELLTPNFVQLRKILEGFARIPYENMSKIVKLSRYWDDQTSRVRLPEEVIRDHISHRLGGTCFSLTFLLQSILVDQGFTCYPVMADMRAGRDVHCCLIAMLDSKKYLLDPGYLLTEPMEINPKRPKLYRTEFSGVELRFDPRIECYNLFTFDQRETRWRYRFQDRPVAPDRFLEHWLASFHLNSMHGICLTKVMKGGMIYVHKNFMRETTFTEKRNHNIKQDYYNRINQIFGIDKGIIEQARTALDENLRKERVLNLLGTQGNSPKTSAFRR